MRNKQCILIVDDCKHVRCLVKVRLKDLGTDLIEAENGEQGIARATKDQPDLILLDVEMPGISGFETCSRLKDNPVTHDIPIIFITGSDDSQHKLRGFDLGAVDYVVKPFDPAELCARARAALHTKMLIDMLAEQASIDALTGLHNRRYFDHRIAQEVEACRRYERRVGLLIVDIDRFKQINDTAGHPVGDHVLQIFASHLRDACRSSDTPCRHGGDEFAIILPEADETAVACCGQRIIRALRDDAELQGLLDTPITGSIGGVSTAGANALRAEELVRRADQALYATKRRGRNDLTIIGQPNNAA